MSKQTDRMNYLIDYRQGLWSSIYQKEDVIWRFISFYAAGAVISFGLINVSEQTGAIEFSNSTIMLIGFVNLVVTLWGLLIVLDANFWMSRNLIFIGNIERQVLTKADYGQLLPSYYSEFPNFRYERSYRFHIVIFTLANLITLVSTYAVVWKQTLNNDEILIMALYSLVFTLGHLVVFFVDRQLVKEFYQVRRDAPGKNPPKAKVEFDERAKIEEVIEGSPISIFSSFSAVVGSVVLVTVLDKQQSVSQLTEPFWHLLVSVALPVAAVIVLFGNWLLQVLDLWELKAPILRMLYQQTFRIFRWAAKVLLFVAFILWFALGYGKVVL